MELSTIAPDDVAICVNYVTDEYESITGTSSGARGLAIRFERDIKNKDGIKIVDGNRIIGFCFHEEFEGKFFIISLYIEKSKRVSKCMYLIFKYCLEQSGDKEVLYIPLHKDMVLPKSLCRNGTIVKHKAIEWINSVKNRYE